MTSQSTDVRAYTQEQVRGLNWFSMWGPTGIFNFHAPTKRTRDRLEKLGLIEKVPETSRLRLTDAGREALSASRQVQG